MNNPMEGYFEPPEWATRDEVIKAAKAYIDYWRAEAINRNEAWLSEMEKCYKAKKQIRELLDAGSGLYGIAVCAGPSEGRVEKIDAWRKAKHNLKQ